MKFLRIVMGLVLLAGAGSVLHGIFGRHEARVALPPLRVEVLNGCAEPGLAQRAAERLQGLGHDVVRVGDAPAGDHARTVVVDRRGRDRLTRAFSRRYGPCPVLLEQLPDADVDLVLVLGADWRQLRLFSRSGPA